eukprot:gene8725-biopygen7647
MTTRRRRRAGKGACLPRKEWTVFDRGFRAGAAPPHPAAAGGRATRRGRTAAPAAAVPRPAAPAGGDPPLFFGELARIIENPCKMRYYGPPRCGHQNPPLPRSLPYPVKCAPPSGGAAGTLGGSGVA